MMKKFLLASALSCAAVIPARADVYYTIDYTAKNGTTDVSSGALIVTAAAAPDPTTGAYTVTGISGTETYNGVVQNVTGLSSYASSDQLFFAAAPYVDLSGVSFTAGGTDYNLYNYNGSDWELSSAVDSIGYPQNGSEFTSLTVAVPEPASMALLGAGLFGLGLIRRRRA
jgi:hypothetical protein